MARPPVPQISFFGDSLANLDKPFGTNLNDHSINGDIEFSSLNQNDLTDVKEFSKFERTVAHFILGRLGSPTIRVELTPFDLKSAIDESITKMNYHAPLSTRQYAVFNASADCSLYDIPSWIIENLEYVVYKKTLLAIAQKGSIEQDFWIKYFQDNYIANDFDMGSFYLLQQNMEMLRKVLGQDGSYTVIDNRYLMLNPAPQNTPEEVIMEFRAINTATISPVYRNWIQRYALMICMDVLGKKRRKYKTLPSPGGGASLDGNELILESLELKSQLTEELFNEIEGPGIPFTLY